MAINEPVQSSLAAGDSRRPSRLQVRELLKEHGLATLIGLITVVIITLIMTAVGDYFVRDHLIFFYLFPITGIAMYFSSTPALVTSLGSAIAAAWIFPPAYSFRMSEPLQIAELFIFCMLALIASKASSRLLR
jgi:K+-sensing histidine kinase KdpD